MDEGFAGGILPIDGLLPATAKVHGLVLVTRNSRELKATGAKGDRNSFFDFRPAGGRRQKALHRGPYSYI